MQQLVTIEQARQRAGAMLAELLQAENIQENGIEKEIEIIDWVFVYCLQAIQRRSKQINFPNTLSKARKKVETHWDH